MSVLNKYKRWVPMLIMHTDNIWDFVLSQDYTPTTPLNGSLSSGCLSAYVDMSKKECITNSGVCSLSAYSWDGAINGGVTLNDIGLTGMDNGLIAFRKDRITNAEFLKLLTESKLQIPADDLRLHLNKVTGNTLLHDYSMSYNDEGYYEMKGGFLQGFYKLHGFDYSVLPQFIENEWNMEFVIRPRDYETAENAVNKTHPENEGIFFYMGTRAENKFAQFYNDALEAFEDRDKTGINEGCEDLMGGVETESKSEANMDDMRKLLYGLFFAGFKETSDCKCEEEPEKEETKKESDSCDEYFKDDYLSDDISLKNIEITTSEGKSIKDNGYYEISTDNKFLTFNRTKYGFTVDNYDPDALVVLTGSTRNSKDNLFLLMNRTKNGYTVDTIDSESVSSTPSYNVKSDFKDNAFALKLNSDGSISYRFLVQDCDAEDGWSIKEESSYSGLVTPDEWNVVTVSFRIMNGSTDNCGVPYGKRKMKVYIYVNGFLKFVSHELPELYFKELNEEFDKQEGVPFNISLGGGTQGLMESIWIDYYKVFDKILPLEKYFAGTFIGDIRSFKFYTCPLEFHNIRNNYLFEIGNVTE